MSEDRGRLLLERGRPAAGDGLKWDYAPSAERLYPNFSHGTAEITGEEQWTELVRRSAQALLKSGTPEERTPGFWNNVGQCGGNAGVGEYFLTLHRVMPDSAYEKMVRRVTGGTLRRATETAGGGLKWVQAEHRTMPDHRLAQTGFMQGRQA